MIFFFEFFNCNKYRRFLIATKFFLKIFYFSVRLEATRNKDFGKAGMQRPVCLYQLIFMKPFTSLDLLQLCLEILCPSGF